MDEQTTPTLAVKCGECGADDEIMAPAPEVATHENRWKCAACQTVNVIEGEAGHPGEGVLNPGAAGLTDEELSEAYQRRIVSMKLEGGLAPSGEVRA